MNISGNIGSRIGALELSDAVSVLYDGRLEEAGGVLQMGYTQVTACAIPTNVNCQRIDDGALENSAADLNAGPSQFRGCTTVGIACGRIDDGALEEAASSIYAGATVDQMGCPGGAPMTKSVIYCRRIDDGALESAAGTLYAGASMEGPCGLTSPQLCRRRIDDGALEDAAGTVYAGSTNQPSVCSPPTWSMSGCRRIDDAALENSASTIHAGSTGRADCIAPTHHPIFCGRHIDDGALEHAADAVGAGPTVRNCRYTEFPCGRIDDGALEEAAGYFHAGPSSSPGDCYRGTGNPFACRRIDDHAPGNELA